VGRLPHTPMGPAVPVGVDRENMSTRVMILQVYEALYDDIRAQFERMGTGDGYCQEQKEYAFTLIDEYGVRATARILRVPRRTLQRWCRAQSKRVRRCPDWVYSWAPKRRERRRFFYRHVLPNENSLAESRDQHSAKMIAGKSCQNRQNTGYCQSIHRLNGGSISSRLDSGTP
jgi:hypothetical protein